LRAIIGDRLDILVANAGISKAAAIEDYTVEDFDDLFAVNVRAPFFLVHIEVSERGQGLTEDGYKEVRMLISGLRPAEGNSQWLIDKTEKFLQEVKTHNSIHHAIEALKTGKGPNKIDVQMIEAAKNFSLTPQKTVLNLSDMVLDFKPRQYLIERLFKRGCLYAMTGLTGAGKSTIALAIAKHVIQGENLGDRYVKPGRVLYLAGEAHENVIESWVGLVEDLDQGLVASSFDLFPGSSKEKAEKYISHAVRKGVAYDLAIVDTSVSYFDGRDKNDNVAALHHAE
jgi:hypothetical protein